MLGRFFGSLGDLSCMLLLDINSRPFSQFKALETLDASANLVQIYAGLVYRGPRLIREIVEAIP